MQRCTVWVLLLFCVLPPLGHGAVTLSAPLEVDAGAQVAIAFHGDSQPRDFITIVPLAHPEGKYEAYQYARRGSVELRAPETAGSYEIRYLGASPPFPTLARQAFTVLPVSATLAAPALVDAGARFPIAWTGPDNLRDFIALADTRPGARKWLSYIYTSKGNPATLTAPDRAGDYEVRYHTGQGHQVLARAPVRIAGTDATVQAPKQIQAGQSFAVAWTGPDNAQDFIAISPQGSRPRAYHHYRYTRDGSPLSLRAPDQAGSYEVRYQTGQSYAVLARQAVSVAAAQATLDAVESIQAGSGFEVEWTGPDNAGDYIGMLGDPSNERRFHGSGAYARYGSPARLRAPLKAGEYQLVYRTGQSGTLLARRPLTVTPAPLPPGRLLVQLAPTVRALAADDAVEIILDASGSMLQRRDGRRRIEIARDALLRLTGDAIPAGTPFALRVFGHREANACRTDLEVPLAPLDVNAVDTYIAGLQARNLAKTPIAESLALVRQDLSGATGKRVVILLTDGEETCGGDPAAAIAALLGADIDVRVNIVGFAIDDEDLKAQFRYWADLGGGSYHDATSAEALQHSLLRALQTPYEVTTPAGDIVATGTTGDSGVELAPGDYLVRTRGSPSLQADVRVKPETTATVNLK